MGAVNTQDQFGGAMPVSVFFQRCQWVLPGVLALAATGTLAQTPSAAPAPEGDAVRIHLQHDSALSGYRVWREQALQPWHEVNAQVARIGGWRAYAREAAEPPQPSARPAPQGSHTGHHGGGQP